MRADHGRASVPVDGTNDLLMSDVLRRHELQVWFLAEHLVDTPAHSRLRGRRLDRSSCVLPVDELALHAIGLALGPPLLDLVGDLRHLGRRLGDAALVAERVAEAAIDAVGLFGWLLDELHTLGLELLVGLAAVVGGENERQAEGALGDQIADLGRDFVRHRRRAGLLQQDVVIGVAWHVDREPAHEAEVEVGADLEAELADWHLRSSSRTGPRTTGCGTYRGGRPGGTCAPRSSRAGPGGGPPEGDRVAGRRSRRAPTRTPGWARRGPRRWPRPCARHPGRRPGPR